MAAQAKKATSVILRHCSANWRFHCFGEAGSAAESQRVEGCHGLARHRVGDDGTFAARKNGGIYGSHRIGRSKGAANYVASPALAIAAYYTIAQSDSEIAQPVTRYGVVSGIGKALPWPMQERAE